MPSDQSPHPQSQAEPAVSMALTERFRLALLEAPPDHEAASIVLQQSLGLNPIDARIRVRHAPGVFPEVFDKSLAEQAAEKLRSLGAKAAAVPSAAVPRLRGARTVHHVRCLDDGFAIVSVAGEVERVIPWTDLRLLSVADVPVPRKSFTGVLPDGVLRHVRGIAQTKITDTDEERLEAWLLCEPPFQAYRMDSELMNYEYLGDDRTTFAAHNFREVIRDLQRHAPHLALTPTAHAYVDGSEIGRYRLKSPDAHRDLVLTHWALRSATTPPAEQDAKHAPVEPATEVTGPSEEDS